MFISMFVAGVWVFPEIFGEPGFSAQHCEAIHWPEICTAGKRGVLKLKVAFKDHLSSLIYQMES